ncbi:hypothetical protein QFZ51_003223 [Chitinophaga sp. W3I9]
MGFKIKLYHLIAVHAIFGTIRQNIEQSGEEYGKPWNDS